MDTFKKIGLGLFFITFICFNSLGQVSSKLDAFKQVEIFGKLNVRLEKSDYDSIYISSGSYDVEKVKYLIEDSVLKIRLLDEFPPEIKVDITVMFQHINSLVVGGGSKVYNRGAFVAQNFELEGKSGCELDLLVNIDTLSVVVNKGAFVRLTGENSYLNLRTSTGGDFRSTNMTNKEMIAVLNGGTAEILSSEYLQATVRLGASLKYVEKPKKIKKKEKLGGTIGKLEDF